MFSIVGSTGGVLVIFIIPGFILLKNKLGEAAVSNPEDSEALQQPQEELTLVNKVKTSARIGAGFLLVCLGCLIFCVTAYVTIVGINNIDDR